MYGGIDGHAQTQTYICPDVNILYVGAYIYRLSRDCMQLKVVEVLLWEFYTGGGHGDGAVRRRAGAQGSTTLTQYSKKLALLTKECGFLKEKHMASSVLTLWVELGQFIPRVGTPARPLVLAWHQRCRAWGRGWHTCAGHREGEHSRSHTYTPVRLRYAHNIHSTLYGKEMCVLAEGCTRHCWIGSKQTNKKTGWKIKMK